MEEHNNNSGRPPGGGDDNKNPRNRQSLLMFMIVAFAALMFWTLVGNRGNPRQEITYNEFLQMLEEGQVESVEIESNQINITSRETDAVRGNLEYYTGIVPDYSLQETLDEVGVE